MRLTVLPEDWGDALPKDIEVLLKDAASHLNAPMRLPFSGDIIVKPAPPDNPPRVIYRPSKTGAFTIQLTARNSKWCQFAYQFSHEFCHVLSDYDRLGENPNNWFHETICEVASQFTLKRMSERWPTKPPYLNWADYSVELARYAEDLISAPHCQLPDGITLGEWVAAHEDMLRADPYQRPLNEVVAHGLLPFFESEHSGWNAIRCLPSSNGRLSDYLSDWAESVDVIDRPFVNELSAILSPCK